MDYTYSDSIAIRILRISCLVKKEVVLFLSKNNLKSFSMPLLVARETSKV